MNEKGKKTVKIELKENKKLKIITPDVISLKTPQGELYKSFPEIRFEKIENTTDGIKIYLS
ncbi:hypothetical protein AKJ50_00620 [candidate division MSBL1 archaeon SCGC-AAA382A13]|uniref:Uncharacterized protein n=1 Tax=candidate division MSBL1 archaeon SCGC-AAA382A13 TaxID=1698279 RepID=A0A133VGI9_9EURY|nr:hypothetical protein AKJ50_00620 [candidate division MSBL1 archaeon SCGC-AAA382A13]